MKYIDLTIKIKSKMPVYPGDDKTDHRFVKKLENDGYNLSYLKIGMHAGTHIDAPMHLIESDDYISDYPISTFIGEGCMIDARYESVISYKDIYEKKVKKDDIVLIYTGNSINYGSSAYFDESPVFSDELTDFLIKKKIKMVGIDSPSPDKYPFNIHKKLFEKGILIIENLTNLDRLLKYEGFRVIALPLQIDAEASIVRVVACI